eukprot:5665029-Pleurochrysis_carterae.AAC.1
MLMLMLMPMLMLMLMPMPMPMPMCMRMLMLMKRPSICVDATAEPVGCMQPPPRCSLRALRVCAQQHAGDHPLPAGVRHCA